MATDSNGNILIVGSESCNIHRLRPNGTLIDIILKKEDGLDFPIAFCFGKDHTKLYVSNSDGTVISQICILLLWQCLLSYLEVPSLP
jgi:hypothetical protein